MAASRSDPASQAPANSFVNAITGFPAGAFRPGHMSCPQQAVKPSSIRVCYRGSDLEPIEDTGGSVAVRAMIVPRGMAPSYYTFLRITAAANGQELFVDRRLRERRAGVQTGVERRVIDRRGPLPRTWSEDGFVLTEG